MKRICIALGCCSVLSAIVLSAAENSGSLKEQAARYLKEHLETEALAAAEAARSAAPDDPEANRLYVTALARNGRYNDAMAAQQADAGWVADDKFRKVVEATALARQANDLMQQSGAAGTQPDYQNVAQLLERAVDLDPNNLAIRLTLGWVYLDKLYQPDLARPHLAVVAEHHPRDVNARKLYGLACIQAGRPHAAVTEFRQASLLQPEDLWIKANLAKSLAQVGQYQEAERLYAEVLAVEPTNPTARLGQAELAAWRGASARPLNTLRELTAENPTNAEALTLMGDIHRWNWRLTEAKENYRQALLIYRNHYGAKTGLEEAERMGASDVRLKAYLFEDTTDFRRASAEIGTRIHLADKAYFLARGAGWHFTNPGFEDIDRLDGYGGLEYHWARWLETSVEGGVYQYEDEDAMGGGQASLRLSPTPHFDLYGVLCLTRPFVSSISTVSNALREDAIGAGFDLRFNRRFSVQTSVEAARISDDNEWIEAKPRLSFRLFGNPGTFVRAEYQYLSYADENPTYWTPEDRNVVSAVFDTTIPLGRNVSVLLVAKAPYVFDEEELGFQAEGGLLFDFRHLELKASAFYSDVPGDEGAWSGQGGQASLRIRF